MRTPHRAAAIVVKDDSILLMERRNAKGHYWVFPGGGIEDTETAEQAVVREIREETTLEVTVSHLAYRITYSRGDDPPSIHSFFICRYANGEPNLGDGNEKDEMTAGTDYYLPQWVKLTILPHLTLYPVEIRDLVIADVQKHFASPLRELFLNIP